MCDVSIYMYIIKVSNKWNMTGTWIYIYCAPLPGLFYELISKRKIQKCNFNAKTSHWKEILVSWYGTWDVGTVAYCMSKIKVKMFLSQKPQDHITLSYFNFRRMCESWKLSDSVLTVWICECGQLVITGEMGASQMSSKPRDTDKNKPCLVACVVSLVLSRLGGGLGTSLYSPKSTSSTKQYSPTLYYPPPQPSSPCNLAQIIWYIDVLKIKNKKWQELDTFTNTEENCFYWNHKTT